jgi:hypothetical protein
MRERPVNPDRGAAASGFAIAEEPDVSDDIPGVPAGLSPITGSVNDSGDRRDVYSISAVAGDKIVVSLAGPAGSDFAVYLYGPAATGVDPVSAPVAFSDTGAYPRGITYVANTPGDYYVEVYAFSGMGDYELSYDVRTADLDDEIPGVPLPASQVKGELDPNYPDGDINDVFRVQMAAGETFRFELIGEEETDFYLRLFGSNAKSVTDDDPVEWSRNAGRGDYPGRLTYTAPAAGTYYVSVSHYEGKGDYTLTYERGRLTTLSLTGPSTVAYKGSGTLKGKLSVVGAGVLAGKKVAIQAKPAGATSWSSAGTADTDQYGNWFKSVKPSKRTQYRAVFAGEPNVYFGAPPSTIKTISPKAYLTAPTAPKTAYKNRYFTTTGYLKPRPGSASVKIKAYKYDTSKKKYVLKKTYTAKLKKYSSTTTKYSARVRFTSRGTWKLVAYTPASVQNAATTSAGRYRRVR